jgi:tellurite resistance protein TehA-like permease
MEPAREPVIKEEYDDVGEERARRVIRWPKWGCFLMIAGIVVPLLWAFVPYEDYVEGALLYIIGAFFAALFFVGLIMLIIGWFKADRLQKKSEPPRTAHHEGDRTL